MAVERGQLFLHLGCACDPRNDGIFKIFALELQLVINISRSKQRQRGGKDVIQDQERKGEKEDAVYQYAIQLAPWP